MRLKYPFMAAGLEDYEPVILLPENNTKSARVEDIESSEDFDKNEADYKLESKFEIYPNPVNDLLSVEYISPEKSCSFVIYNTNGQKVKTINKSESLAYITIDVSDLESGNYIISSPQLNSRKQFVVKH